MTEAGSPAPAPAEEAATSLKTSVGDALVGWVVNSAPKSMRFVLPEARWTSTARTLVPSERLAAEIVMKPVKAGLATFVRAGVEKPTAPAGILRRSTSTPFR